VLSFELTSTSPGIGPFADVLPASGKWADEIDIGTYFELKIWETTYFVVVDYYGDYGYDYTISTEVVQGVENEVLNDDCATTTPVHTLPIMIEGYVNAADRDWYAFDVSSADVGKLIHVVTDGFADTMIEVLEPHPDHLTDCNQSLNMTGLVDDGRGEEVITDPTDIAGTYYVSVMAWGASDTGQYTLFVELLGEGGPNDSCTDAVDMSALPYELESAWMDDTTDTEDWYKITMTTGDIGKAFEIITGAGVDGMTDTVLEVWYDADNNCTLTEGENGGQSDDVDYGEHFVTPPIDTVTGTYYVRVFASEYDWGEGDYTLSVNLVDSEEPTDVCADATTALSIPFEMDAAVGEDDVDWFAFEVTSGQADSQLDIYTYGRADPDVYAYELDTDCNNPVMLDTDVFGLYGPLEAGTYYIEVDQAGYDVWGPYTLVVDVLSYTIAYEDECCTSPYDPNDDCSVAQDMASLPFYLSLGYLDDEYDADWYSIDVASGDIGNAIYVETSWGNADTLVEVFDGCFDGTPGTSLGGPSEDSGAFEYHYSGPITAAGIHYVMVSSSPDAGPISYNFYDMWVETMPPTP